MKIGIIGYGGRMQGIVRMMEEFNAGMDIVAVTDPNWEKVQERLAKNNRPIPEARVYSDADEMLGKEDLDAVMVGTRCSLHAQMALKVLERGLPMYLEKPIATNRADLEKLAAAEKKAKAGVVVSFPLRVSPICTTAMEIIESGKIGSIETLDAWNDPPYGATYFRNWYRDECETGGLWLQKATHDFDYITRIVGSPPKQVAAMTSKRVFTGDRPAGLMCRDCEDWEDCLESPFHIYYSRGEAKAVEASEFYCMFAQDTGNEDAGHALVEFENGVQASYTQVFMARRQSGRRGARIYGYKGTVEFDWFTDEVKVYMNHSPRIETYSVGSKQLSHAGGDTVLVWNFIQVVHGREESVSPLSAGITSVNLCLAARDSSQKRAFQEVRPL